MRILLALLSIVSLLAGCEKCKYQAGDIVEFKLNGIQAVVVRGSLSCKWYTVDVPCERGGVCTVSLGEYELMPVAEHGGE